MKIEEFKIAELLNYLQIEIDPNILATHSLLQHAPAIHSICLDSRMVQPGALFIAVPGLKTDGRQYIAQAIQQQAAVILAEAISPSTEVVPQIAAGAAGQSGNTCFSVEQHGNTLLIYYHGVFEHIGAIVSWFYNHPSKQLKIIGVTGTNGKTSTCYYVAKILAALAKPCGMIGTIGIGLPDQLTTITHTTPDQVTLQAGLANFCQQHINYVAMEVSSHGLVQQRVAGVEFDTVVFTNLTQDHADYHGTTAAYWDAKLQLFLQYKYRHVVVNLDDPFGRQLIALLPADVKITGISLMPQRQELNLQYLGSANIGSVNLGSANLGRVNLEIISAQEIQYSLTKITAQIQARSGSGQLQVNLLGEGSLYNVLTAMAVCLGYGFTFAEVLQAAQSLSAPQGRMQIVGGNFSSPPHNPPPNQRFGGGLYNFTLALYGKSHLDDDFNLGRAVEPVVVVDYAHTPAALTQALLALRRHCHGKLYCVFGCGGDRDRTKRPLMLAEALQYSDVVIVTQDNPRTEAPEQILADMLAEQPQQLPENLILNLDRAAAIQQAIAAATANDMVLIAGKGHEDYQLIANKVLPFSDVAVARAALNAVYAPSQVSTDTRTLQAGDLFVAIKGENFDGHDFIAAAIHKGAAGIVVSENYVADIAAQEILQQEKIPTLVVADTLVAYGKIAAAQRQLFSSTVATAITGSCGKTSVKEMLTNILQQCGPVLASSASYNNEIGLPRTLLQLKPEHQAIVVEMGARNIGDIAYLMGIAQPQIALITKVVPCHLETFKDLDGIAQAKGEIYTNLAATGTAVINVDDVYAPYWLSLLQEQQIITFGLNSQADFTAINIVAEGEHTSFDLVHGKTAEKVAVKLFALGMHQVQNALAAAACAYAQGVSMVAIAAGLATFTPVTGRGELKAGLCGAVVIDDAYNANPGSIKAGLAVLAARPGKKIFAMGDMLELGENSAMLHKTVGEYAQQIGIDYLLGFGDLCQQAVIGFGKQAKNYSDKQQLVADLLELMDAETTVLVKGSNGMRMSEVVQAIAI